MAALLGFLNKKQETAPTAASEPAKATDTVKGTPRGAVPFLVLLPYRTEKATRLQEQRQWCFEAAPTVTKAMVAQSVARMWHVRVEKVRMVPKVASAVWFGKTRGHTRTRKKFMVTLAPGQTLPLS